MNTDVTTCKLQDITYKEANDACFYCTQTSHSLTQLRTAIQPITDESTSRYRLPCPPTLHTRTHTYNAH